MGATPYNLVITKGLTVVPINPGRSSPFRLQVPISQ
jgi:hypothetical protein